MSFTSEFREFAVKGNVMDLAVGVMIGAAFQKIVTSLVNDILMPPIGYVTGGIDFSYLALNLATWEIGSSAAATATQGEPVVRFGMFINESINFLILALVLFFIVRTMNRMRRKEEKKEEKIAKAKAAAT